MNPIKNLVNKKMPFFIVSLLVLGAIVIYFGLKSKRASLELKSEKANYEQTRRENLGLKDNYAKIKNNYDKLQKEHQALTLDRNNLYAQAKILPAERERARLLEVSLEKGKKDTELTEKQKQEILEKNLSLKEQIKDLQIIQKQLIKEKEQLLETLEKEREKSGIKRLEEQAVSLKKENTDLNNSLKIAQSELGKLKESDSRAKEEIKQLTEKVDRFNKDYAEAVKKNKDLERQIIDSPTKFAELARQNKLLIKQTANMHYNLGVFYMQQREYSRAAAELEKAVELTPDDAYAHFNLGYIYAEYLVNRQKAIEHFRQYLRHCKKEDKDTDWVKKYILTWESWEGKKTLE